MWEAIGESLKVFVEKHLVPTVSSVVVAILAVLLLPDEYAWMIEKVGKNWFMLLIAGVVFLAVELVIWLFSKVRNGWYGVQNKAYYKRQEAKESQEQLEQWLSFVDRLSADDRELIMTFIRTNNAPQVQRANVYRCYNPESIHATNAIVSQKNKDGSTTYKLDDRFYRTMKAIYEDRGSISHFN